jgi:hypothetical protein
LAIRAWFFLFAGVTLGSCRSRAEPAASSQPQAKQAASTPVAGGGTRSPGLAIRIPAKGGALRAYRLPGLAELPGAVRGKLPPVKRVVGLDPEAELLFAVTDKRDVVALDVAGGRLDTVAAAIEQATLGPDGTLYAVDSMRRVVTLARRIRLAWPQPLEGVPRELFGADQRLVAVLAQDPPRMITASPNQPPASRVVPLGSDLAATRWGDLVAVASDSGVLLMDPLGRRDAAFVPLTDHPRALVFSPSGHRIYVARRTGPGLAVIDRYERKEIDGVALPTPAAAIRMDPAGRWLLARPSVGDSAWIVDLPTRTLVGAVATAWSVELPAIGPDGALLVRQGNDLVAYRPDSLKEIGRVPGARADFWTLTTWRPRGGYQPSLVAEAQAATPMPGAADSLGPEGPLYVQVSTSQNESWSSGLAQQLSRAGLAAKVLPPQTPDDGYRVVLGPYITRAQAEDIGRKLGRPFWIYQPNQ